MFGSTSSGADQARMTATYVHHSISAAPRRWRVLAERLAGARLAGGTLYGVWRSQIGRPRDELTAITVWDAPIAAAAANTALLGGALDVQGVVSEAMQPTLRPLSPEPPRRQGNYAFRRFVTPEAHWPEFLDLCTQAWPGFEAAYDSQVIGLWRLTGDRSGPAEGPGGGMRSLLLTRRPDLAMWERSKLPQGAAETAVRDALSRRYDLCDWTVVHTTTLLTAANTQDLTRWT
jgi:hypothetical protein